MEKSKKLLQSKTVWLAIIQGVVGIAIAVLTDLDMVGYVAVVKSFADIALRYVTKQPIS